VSVLGRFAPQCEAASHHSILTIGRNIHSDYSSSAQKTTNWGELAMDASARPLKLHEYSEHPIIDSTRWRVYKHRPGDIVISTSYKAGTTWTQTIVANLLFQDGNFPAPIGVMSPWLDMTLPPLDMIAEGLEAQTHRRFIKTHLALDGLDYYDTCKYIVVGRDARDVFMSLWNHHSSYTDGIKAKTKADAKEFGRDFPVDIEDIHTLWDMWISKGWYEWESDGYPYWSHLHHARTWWEYRHLPNIAFLHYSDLLADPEAEVRRIAEFLDIAIDDAQMPGILERISFGSMKENFKNIMPEAEIIWNGGGQAFMNKGTNGRWRDVLSADDLRAYETAVAKTLTPECAKWLEDGGPVDR
jgi:aryl sulfotransferase